MAILSLATTTRSYISNDMASHARSSSYAGEEYELQSPSREVDPSPVAGPSRLRPTKQPRTLTLHPSVSTSALLFASPNGPASPRQRRRGSLTDPSNRRNQHRAQFLEDEPEQGEEVHVPDIGHILGIDDTNEDHFAIAARMQSPWKRRLYLLMEEPSSGREAFTVHVMVTGAILFRWVERVSDRAHHIVPFSPHCQHCHLFTRIQHLHGRSLVLIQHWSSYSP